MPTPEPVILMMWRDTGNLWEYRATVAPADSLSEYIVLNPQVRKGGESQEWEPVGAYHSLRDYAMSGRRFTAHHYSTPATWPECVHEALYRHLRRQLNIDTTNQGETA